MIWTILLVALVVAVSSRAVDAAAIGAMPSLSRRVHVEARVDSGQAPWSIGGSHATLKSRIKVWDYSPGVNGLRKLRIPRNSSCWHLDGAYVDDDAVMGIAQVRKLMPIHSIKTNISVHSLADPILTKLIELGAARIISEHEHRIVEPLGGGFIPAMPVGHDEENLRRFACYMASDANNNWLRLVINGRKLLRYVDGQLYFNTATTLQLSADREAIPVKTHIPFEPLDRELVEEDAERVWREHESGSIHHPAVMLGEEKTKIIYTTEARNTLGMRLNAAGNDRIVGSLQETQPHRLAFFLMVHKNFEQVVALLKTLVDKYAVVLIHVDAKAPGLKSQLQQYLDEQTAYPYKRVRIMKQSFNGLWGHSSLVFAELAGFFELLDMDANWEYVINLSGEDYMLRHNDVAYRQMKRDPRSEGNPTSYLEYTIHNDYALIHRNHMWPLFQSSDKCAGYDFDYPYHNAKVVYETIVKQDDDASRLKSLEHPFPAWYTYKLSQWMVLHRQHVQAMRMSPMTSTLLAYAEWNLIPDESFFATLMRNHFSDILVKSDRFNEGDDVGASMHVVNSHLRLITWSGHAHPDVVTESRADEITDRLLKNDVVACRKVTLDIMPFLDQCKDIDRTRFFGFGIGNHSRTDVPKDDSKREAWKGLAESRPKIVVPPVVHEDKIFVEPLSHAVHDPHSDSMDSSETPASKWRRLFSLTWWRQKLRHRWDRIRQLLSTFSHKHFKQQ